MQQSHAFITWVRWLENRAEDWRLAYPSETAPAAFLVAQYLRRYQTDQYTDLKFNAVMGTVNQVFIDWADDQPGRPDPASLHDPLLGPSDDIEHFGATLCGCFNLDPLAWLGGFDGECFRDKEE